MRVSRWKHSTSHASIPTETPHFPSLSGVTQYLCPAQQKSPVYVSWSNSTPIVVLRTAAAVADFYRHQEMHDKDLTILGQPLMIVMGSCLGIPGGGFVFVLVDHYINFWTRCESRTCMVSPAWHLCPSLHQRPSPQEHARAPEPYHKLDRQTRWPTLLH